MDNAQGMQRFAKSVAMGTLVGGGPFLLITVPLAILFAFDEPHDLFRSAYLAVLPLLVSFVLVLVGSAVIGLPLVWLLRKLKVESYELYCGLGLVFGGLIPLVILLLDVAQQGYWLCVVGAGSGAATAHAWSRSGDGKVRSRRRI